MIVMPDQDVVIAITAETPDMQEEINLVWEHVLPAIHQNKLPVSKSAEKLKQKLSSLSLPVPAKTTSSLAAGISGKAFLIEPNEKKIQSISFTFHNDICDVNMQTDTANYNLAFGSGMWQSGETTNRGPSLVAGAKASFVGLPPLKINGAYSWKDENTLVLTLRYIESPHTEKFTCGFDETNLSIDIENSFDYGSKKITLKGKSKD
jgi:hypothetical protein